tara:strand:- start:292 stop:1032 length:741 start_codon:yes stop_codon:yes gene_type:complete
MSGVNSINWARIAVQTVYYFFSYFKIAKQNEKINFSVPTGNFGNIYSGYIAKKMGLPINKLIIATNKNDILKRVFTTGLYKPLNVMHTLSPSMDIQVASNFERLIFDLCSCDSNKVLNYMKELDKKGEFHIDEKELKNIREHFDSESLPDEEIKLNISEIYKNQKTLIDPHTSVGIGILKKLSLEGNTIVLSTAHPSKFSEVVKGETKQEPELPKKLKHILSKEEKYEKFPNDLRKIKNYILQKCG